MSTLPEEDVIAVATIVAVVASYVVSEKWSKVQRKMFQPEIVTKERSIAKAQAEAARLNTPSTFHLYAKAQRSIQAEEKELTALKAARRNRNPLVNFAPVFVQWFVRFAIIIPLAAMYGDRELLMLPPFTSPLPLLIAPVRSLGVLGIAAVVTVALRLLRWIV